MSYKDSIYRQWSHTFFMIAFACGWANVACTPSATTDELVSPANGCGPNATNCHANCHSEKGDICLSCSYYPADTSAECPKTCKDPFSCAYCWDPKSPDFEEYGCYFDCPAKQTLCENTCVALDSDKNNCGACGKTCGDSEKCANAKCVQGCAGTLCSGSCIDTAIDKANCGKCGNICPEGESCIQGSCSSTTGYGLTQSGARLPCGTAQCQYCPDGYCSRCEYNCQCWNTVAEVCDGASQQICGFSGWYCTGY